MACSVGSSWPICIFGLVIHLIEDRHTMLNYISSTHDYEQVLDGSRREGL